MSHQIFICYSSRDKAVADAACAALEAQRFKCWIAPRDVLAGIEYGRAIIEALAECQIVLLIFSQNANDSPQVRREIERAVSKEKIILPFRIEDVLPSHAMEYALGNTHWLDALTPPMELRLSDLCQTASRLIDRKDAGRDYSSSQSDLSGKRSATTLLSESDTKVALVSVASQSWFRSHKLGVWAGGILALLTLGTLGVLPRLYQAQAAKVVAIQQSKCDKGSTVDCIDLGSRYESGTNVAQDDVNAVSLYRKACDDGYSVGCTRITEMYRARLGTVRDDSLELVSYQNRCDAGKSEECASLGSMYELGLGVSQNESRAKELYGKACDWKSARGCFYLAGMWVKGNGGFTKAESPFWKTMNRTAGMGFYRQACAGKYQPACDALKSIDLK